MKFRINSLWAEDDVRFGTGLASDGLLFLTLYQGGHDDFIKSLAIQH